MEHLVGPVLAWLMHPGRFIIPTLLALWMAVGDLRTRRIPNYLTLGTALAGLAVQGLTAGWSGLSDGLLGLLLGFFLLFGLYLMGGMGAGDVKALAALGAWMGLKQTFVLFIYMGLAGGLLALFYLWLRGILTARLKRLGSLLLSWILLRPHAGAANSSPPPDAAPDQEKLEGVPYGVALALGMAAVCWEKVFA
jgi:prepilin peptidase CpaA